jgi:hypothetical protein
MGFISWILDLLRLKNELEVENMINLHCGRELHYGCGTPPHPPGGGSSRDTASSQVPWNEPPCDQLT